MTDGIRGRQRAGVIILTRILRDWGFSGPDGARGGGGVYAGRGPGRLRGWERRKVGDYEQARAVALTPGRFYNFGPEVIA